MIHTKIVTTGLFFFLCFASFLAHAQTHPTIRTGRPGQSIGANAVGQGYLQIQSGVDYGWQDGTDAEQWLINNVIRFGATETFELSGVLNLSHHSVDVVGSDDEYGVSSVQLGGRFNIIDRPQGWVPALGIQARFQLPWTADAFEIDNVAPIVLVATVHSLAPQMSWAHNVGLRYDGGSSNPTKLFISNVSYSFNSAWGTFVEVYGQYKNDNMDVFFDTGLSYLVHEDLQLDMSFGMARNDSVNSGFVSLGVSYRAQLQKRSASL